MEVHGNVSYSSQDPWIFPATIRQNITFGEEYDKTRYEEVVRVCALEYDFSMFDEGDQTVLTDRGHNLSKGQQARINLARAVYRNTNIYLLDDSLTALDTHVQEYIFNECLMKFLKDKIVILVSQNSTHTEKADQIIVLHEGKMLNKEFDKDSTAESMEKLVTSGDEKRKTKELIKEIDEDKSQRKSSKKSKKKLLQTEQQQTKKSIYREIKKQGKVDLTVYKKYFQYGGGFTVFLCIMMIYVGAQFCDSYSDKLLTTW